MRYSTGSGALAWLGVAVDAIAREGLGSDSFRTRTAALSPGRARRRVREDIIRQLADLYPQVRVAAIAGLEHLRPDGAGAATCQYECYVPAGEFIMGEDKEAHRVTLNAFYIDKYPVTNAEYARFMADAAAAAFDMPAGKENHPVVNMDWYSAKGHGRMGQHAIADRGGVGEGGDWKKEQI